MVNKNQSFYLKSDIKKFKDDVSKSRGGKFYFSPSSIKFFKSRVTKVYKTPDDKKYLALEQVYRDNKPLYNVLVLDKAEKKFYRTIDSIENKKKAEEIFKEIKMGEIDYKKILNE